MPVPQASRYDTGLLHERQHVRDAWVLADQAGVVEPHDVDELSFYARAGRRGAWTS
jgi:hypothetical protein